MSRRHVIVAAMAVVLAAAIVALALRTAEKEPVYQGKTLSEWARLRNSRPEAATNAVLAIGTNALPVLIKWADVKPRLWRVKGSAAAQKLPNWLGRQRIVDWVSQDKKLEERAEALYFCFQVLGARASPAIPELKRLIRVGPYSPFEPAHALAYVGSDGMLALVRTLQEQPRDPDARLAIASALRFVTYRGSEATQAVPVLIACLGDTNLWVQAFAAQALGNFAAEPRQSIPALTNAAQSTDFRLHVFAIRALGQFGTQALPAITVVSNALTEPGMQREAQKALDRITDGAER